MSKILDALNAIYKEKKKLAGVTQKIIGERLGVAPSAVSQYLSGDTGITIVLLEKFCAALEIKLSDLENWNPELAEIRHAQSTAKAMPKDLAKAVKQLGHLRRVNRQAFDGLIGSIDSWFRASSDMPAESAPAPELEKKAKASCTVRF